MNSFTDKEFYDMFGMTKADKCKEWELDRKGFGTFNNALDKINSMPVIGGLATILTFGFSVWGRMTESGLDRMITESDCADLAFKEIKEILDKRFNELERKLDEHTVALEAVSKLEALPSLQPSDYDHLFKIPLVVLFFRNTLYNI